MTPAAVLLAVALGAGAFGPAAERGEGAHAVRQSPEAPPASPAPPPPAPFDGLDVGDVLEGGGEVYAAPVATDTLRPAEPPPVLDAYRADPDFQYDRPEAEGPSLWERFWDWVWRTLWGPIEESTSAGFRDVVLIGLAVLALGWVVARLLRAEGGGVFGRSERAGGTAGPLLDAEDIAEVDLGSRLRSALGAEDHREAVRVRYLLLLQALDAAGTIAWRRDKTNRQYVAEVRAADPDRAGAFARATRAFDAVWYGERSVSADLYARLAPAFDEAAPAPVSA